MAISYTWDYSTSEVIHTHQKEGFQMWCIMSQMEVAPSALIVLIRTLTVTHKLLQLMVAKALKEDTDDLSSFINWSD